LQTSNWSFCYSWFQANGTGTVRINLTRFGYPINFGKGLERYETFSIAIAVRDLDASIADYQLRHVGFEDDAVQSYSNSHHVNGIEWECFSANEQDQRIVQAYGVPVKQST